MISPATVVVSPTSEKWLWETITVPRKQTILAKSVKIIDQESVNNWKEVEEDRIVLASRTSNFHLLWDMVESFRSAKCILHFEYLPYES